MSQIEATPATGHAFATVMGRHVKNPPQIFTFDMRSVNGEGDNDTPPGRPTGLMAAAAPSATPQPAVALSWTAPRSDGSSPIGGYAYVVKTGSGDWGDWIPIPDSGAGEDNEAGYTVTGLAVTAPPATLHFRVRAVNGAGAGKASEQSASVTFYVPGAPVNLSAEAGGDAVRLQWGTPASDGGSPIAGYQYRLKVGDGGFGDWTDIRDSAPGEANANGYTLSGLADGTLYTLRVRAKSAVGGGLSKEVFAIEKTVPGAPQSLVARAGKGDEVALEWTAPAFTGGSAIAGYQYRYRTGNGGFGAWESIPFSGMGGDNETGYTVSGLEPGTQYTFKVGAKNALGAGPAATATATTPVPVWALTLTDPEGDAVSALTEGGAAATATVRIVNGVRFGAARTVRLRWGGSSIGTGLIQGAGGVDTIAIPAGGDGGSLSLSAPEPGGVAQYRPRLTKALTATLAGRGTGGTRIGAIDLSFVDDEEPPVARIAQAPSSVGEGGTIELEIALDPAFASLPPGQRTVALAVTVANGVLDGAPPAGVTFSPGQTTNTLTLTAADNTVKNDGAREVTVALLTNPDAPYTLGTPATVTVKVRDNDTPPGRPTGLMAAAAPSATPQPAVALSWTAPRSDGSSPIGGYAYVVKTGSGDWGDWIPIPDSGAGEDNEAGYTVTGLAVTAPPATLHFRVRAVNGAGAGKASEQSASVTFYVPGAPVNLSAEAGGDAVRLQWGTPASDGGSPIAGYQYRLKVGDGGFGDWTDIRDSAPGEANANGYTLSGLADGTLYTLRVRAKSAVGGGLSKEVFAIEKTVPGAPQSLVARAGKGDEVALEWTAPAFTGGSAIAGYQYRYRTGNGGFGAWESIPFSGMGGDNETGYTVSGLEPGTQYTFKVGAKNALGAGPAATATATTPVPVWALTLTDPEGDAVSALTEGGAAATATVRIVNGVRFGAARTVRLRWGGSSIGTGLIQGAGGVDTIAIPAGGDGGSLSLSAPEPGGVAQYRPRLTKALTATLAGRGTGGTRIGAIDLSFVDDEEPPVARIAQAPSSVGEGGTIELEIALDPAFASLPPGQRTVALAVTVANGVLDGAPPAGVTFSPGQTTNTLTLTAADNTVKNDGAREVTVALLTNPDAPYTLGTPATVTVKVRDNDTPPGRPTGLMAAAGDGQVTLSWVAPEDAGGPPVMKYQLRWKAGANAAFGDGDAWTDIPGGAGANGHTVTRLAGATAYSFELRAVNAAGEGEAARIGVTTTGGVAVAFAAAAAAANEGGSIEVTVTLGAAPAEAVTVPIAATPGPGLAADEYSGVPASVTFGEGETSKSFTVTFAGDAAGTEGGSETLTLGFGALPEGYAAGTPAQTVLTVRDAAPPEDVSVMWSGVLTVKDYDAPGENGTGLGTNGADSARQISGAVSNLDKNGKKLGLDWLWYHPVTDKLHLAITIGLERTDNVTLRLTNDRTGQARAFRFPPSSEGDRNFTWYRAGLDWQGGDEVTVELIRPAPPPEGLSVADAQVRERQGSELEFRVTLEPARASEVTVQYRTSDGTGSNGAKAPADYVAKSGILIFAPGETEKWVSVMVRGDSHDEDRETMTLVLSQAAGAAIADGEATGTIINTGAIPQAWIVRFARTVAGQVIEAVEGRMRAPRTPEVALTIAGERVGGGAAPVGEKAEAAGARERLSQWLKNEIVPEARRGDNSRAVGAREVLAGSSFSVTEGSPETGFYSLWARGAASRIGGRDGGLALGGEVMSGMVGADWSSGPGSGAGAWTVGLMVAHSRGEGTYRGAAGAGLENGPTNGPTNGKVRSSLTGVYPWFRHGLSERLSVWGVAGYGAGTLTVTPEDQDPIRTGMDMMMAAAGLRGVVLQAAETGGFELALKTDVLGVRTTSKKASGLAAAEGEATRVQLGLEGSRAFRFGSGAVLTPRLEVGVRHDGGDAETGFGVDLGAGVAWADPRRGLSADLRARGLLVHRAKGFRELGLSGALRWDPRPDSDRGVRMTLSRTMGGQASGGMDALLERETLAGLADAGSGAEDALAQRRFEMKLGYGFAILGGRFTLVPEAGFGLSPGARDYSLGWRLAEEREADLLFDLGLEARRREDREGVRDAEHEAALGFGWRLGGARRTGALVFRVEARSRLAANDNDPEHGVGFSLTARW